MKQTEPLSAVLVVARETHVTEAQQRSTYSVSARGAALQRFALPPLSLMLA